jgi:hypothetical protein
MLGRRVATLHGRGKPHCVPPPPLATQLKVVLFIAWLSYLFMVLGSTANTFFCPVRRHPARPQPAPPARDVLLLCYAMPCRLAPCRAIAVPCIVPCRAITLPCYFAVPRCALPACAVPCFCCVVP